MLSNHLNKIWTGPEVGDPKPIIYLSGCENEQAIVKAFPSLLRFVCVSYFSGQRFIQEFAQEFTQRDIRCFLDSGAFSYQMQALKKKHPLDQRAATVIIDQYVKWVRACPFIFDFLVTFDYSRDAGVTEWATKRIEAQGLRPVPVYHLGSPITALQQLMNRGYSLIGIGGMVPYKANVCRPFLDQVFSLTEKYQVRCHGFGIGSLAMFQYPWFSVDTTAWLYLAKHGQVLRPSKDPRRVMEQITTSLRTAMHRGNIQQQTLPEQFDRDSIAGREWAERIIQNIQFYNSLMDTPPPAIKVKRGLF